MSKKNTVGSSYQNIILLVSIIPILIFGFLTYNNSKQERIQSTFEQIENLNIQKKKIITDYFQDIKFNTKELIKTIAFLQEQATRNIVIIQTLQRDHIQKHYHAVENDLISLAKKDIYQYIYSFLKRGKIVEQTHLDSIYAYKEELGIKNILMMDKEGKILYSSDETSLVGTNADELLGTFKTIFSHLKQSPKEVKVSFVRTGHSQSIQPYKQYAISPFKDVDGYIAIEMRQEDIQSIIKNVASLGSTAETYLAYKNEDDMHLASNRHIKLGKIGDKTSCPFVEKGFTKAGVGVKYSSLGEIELVGYMPIEVNNLILSMQTTVTYTEIISPTIDGFDYFEKFMSDYDYNNVMLVSANGGVFYSILKEDDYQTSVYSGKYNQSPLSKAIKEVFINKKYTLTDIISYEVSSKGIAQFALFPQLRADGSVQSIVVIEVNLDTLSKKLADDTSIYETYETYVVGSDYGLRSDTRLKKEKYNVVASFKDNILVQTQAVRDAFSKEVGNKTMTDYRGVRVLTSFDTIMYSNFEWAIISEIDEEEVELMVSKLKSDILIFVLISSIIALIAMAFITNEKKKQDKRIEYAATHDELTGLPNRKFVLEFLDFMLAKTRRKKNKGAVLYIDLDKFKIINDNHGHKAGDFVLREVAKRLKNTSREEDVIARLGGDEFILLMNNYETLHDIDTFCKKIIESVSQEIQGEDKSYKVGLSIGIATFPDDSSTAEELLQFSDIAMFQTKDNGKNGYTYYSKEMTEKSLRRSRVEAELKDAISSNQLVLYYQPQVDLATKKVVGVEALVRWNHPQDDLVMPNDFIPLAEESSLILDLGYWVAFEACKTFKKWKDDGSDLKFISINMSTKQLQCPSCIKNIQTIVSTLDFNPEWLEIEITETTLISDLENTLLKIELFKEMGIKFSIDDFGTGYSSLAYLKSLQIQKLKIDREFIKDMIRNKDRTIVEAIILMGHTLGYTIVAEGAESKEEMELLKYLACDIIQGYYYSRPLPEDKIIKYINEQNND